MKSIQNGAFLVGMCALGLSLQAVATTFDEGLKAFEAKDYARALEIWTPLAEKHDVAAEYNLGVMYQRAYGVHRDLTRAAWYFREAAGHGHVKAMLNIGFCYANGHGVGQSYQEAYYWMRKAADEGNADAMFNVGGMFYNGWGVKRDLKAAIAWTELAASQGVPGAKDRLDIMTGKKGKLPELIQ